jgi:hypothetical protein
MGKNRIKIIREKINRSPMAISSLKGIGKRETIKNGRRRIKVKMENRNTAVRSFSLIDVITPNKKKINKRKPIRMLSLKIASM